MMKASRTPFPNTPPNSTTKETAGTSEILTLSCSLPLDVPKIPSFGREEFKHEIKVLHPGIAYDDLYHLNTQSGTQWDGMRHVSFLAQTPVPDSSS